MRKLYITIVLVLSLILNSNLSFGQDYKIENSLVDAVQLIENGQYKEAINILNKLKEQDPKNDAVYYYLGTAFAGLGNAENTEMYLCKAAQMDSTNYWYRYNLGNMYTNTGSFDKGIKVFESLLKDFPKETELYNILAFLFIQKNDPENALKYMSQMDEMFGKSERTTIMRYQLLSMMGKKDEATQVLKDYTKEFASPEILCMIGDDAKQNLKDSLANAYYDEALVIDKDYPRALIGKGDLALYKKDFKTFLNNFGKSSNNMGFNPQAIAYYVNVINAYPGNEIRTTFPEKTDSIINNIASIHSADTTVTIPIARYYILNQQMDKAKGIFKNISDNNPQDLKAFISYIQFYYSFQDWKGLANAIKNEGLQKFPNNLDLIDLLLYAYYQDKDYQQIIKTCEDIIKENKDNKALKVRMLGQIGDIYIELNQKAKAYKVYDQALKIDKMYIPILNNYAYYLSLEGKNLKKAYKMSKATVEAEPKNPTFLDTFGWILYLQGKPLEAKPFFKQAMIYGGKESAVIMMHYSLVLEALGEKDLAEFYHNLAKSAKEKE